jgi:hypothetical protein
MNSGVYAIKHRESGRCYVGSSKDMVRRMKLHQYFLDKNVHHSTKLQRAWNKYGKEAFEFSMLLKCDVKNLLMYEQIAINGFDSANAGFNVCVKAGSREGTPHDEATLCKMRESQRIRRKKYDWNGKQMCLAEIAENISMPAKTLERRVNEGGMTLEAAAAMPYKRVGQPIQGMNCSLTFYEWVERIGCTESFLRLWLQKGLSIEQCIAKHKRITAHEFARLNGVDDKMFHARLKADWSVGDAIAYPKVTKGGKHLKSVRHA